MNLATFDPAFIDFRPAEASVGQRVRGALTQLLVLGSFTATLLLGWGWDDVLQLFSHPARATLLVALMLQLAFSVAQARPLIPARERAENQLARVLFWLFAAASLSIVASAAFWEHRIMFMLPGEDLTRYIGLGLFLVGLAINAWQRISSEVWRNEVPIAGHRWNAKDSLRLLGRSFYPGLLMAVVGLPMVFLSKLALAGSACFVVLSLVRAIWSVRMLYRTERVSEQRLEAA